MIGWAYIFCWCLLQLLLQQPINAMPILLLLVQILTSLLHFSYSGLHHKEWVEVGRIILLCPATGFIFFIFLKAKIFDVMSRASPFYVAIMLDYA